MTEKPQKRRPKAPSEGGGYLLGWIFVVLALFGVVFMILHAKPEGRMVCDSGRAPSLIKFGSCHTE